MSQSEFRISLDTGAVQGVIALAARILETAKAAGVEQTVVKQLTEALTFVVDSVKVERAQTFAFGTLVDKRQGYRFPGVVLGTVFTGDGKELVATELVGFGMVHLFAPDNLVKR